VGLSCYGSAADGLAALSFAPRREALRPEGGKVAKAATSRHTVTETLPRWSFQKNFCSNFGQNGNTHSIKRCQYRRSMAEKPDSLSSYATRENLRDAIESVLKQAVS